MQLKPKEWCLQLSDERMEMLQRVCFAADSDKVELNQKEKEFATSLAKYISRNRRD